MCGSCMILVLLLSFHIHMPRVCLCFSPLCSYMTIFYLQQLQMLPALSELVPGELLRQPEERLLQVRLLCSVKSRSKALSSGAARDLLSAWATCMHFCTLSAGIIACGVRS